MPAAISAMPFFIQVSARRAAMAGRSLLSCIFRLSVSRATYHPSSRWMTRSMARGSWCARARRRCCAQDDWNPHRCKGDASVDRRAFMAQAAMAAAFFGESAGRAEAAPAPFEGFWKSLADFGVVPGSDKDQSAAMQKALDELASSGQPAFLPPGRYRISGVRLGSRSALFGVEGFSVIEPATAAPIF